MKVRVLILKPFTTESLIGIRKTSGGLEAFHLRAKSSVADTELLRLYEEGNIL